MLDRALEGILSLPFASPSAFVLTDALVPESLTIRLIAHSQHTALIEAIEHRQGSRAESIAREHARIAMRNLAIVTHHREMLAGFPGASLVTLPRPREHEPV
jgi:GntR family transcriptional regulator, vanillate catabolism transcriptional regulator